MATGPMATDTIETDAPPVCEIRHDVSWTEYERFLEENEERRRPHSYVDGELRFMSPSARHESPKKWIAQLVEALTDELNLPRRSIGSLTFKLGLEERGAEPDEGYLIANASAIEGKREYDYENDPPPDLLIEVDITTPSLNRLPVYASLGVREIWIYDGEDLEVRVLDAGKSYRKSETSLAFPALPMQEFAPWIEEAWLTDETTWIRRFREWVRATLSQS